MICRTNSGSTLCTGTRNGVHKIWIQDDGGEPKVVYKRKDVYYRSIPGHGIAKLKVSGGIVTTSARCKVTHVRDYLRHLLRFGSGALPQACRQSLKIFSWKSVRCISAQNDLTADWNLCSNH